MRHQLLAVYKLLVIDDAFLMPVYTLTLRVDQKSQDFFDQQRKAYFPKERNLLDAHLTLFHHLVDYDDIVNFLKSLVVKQFDLEVNSLRFLGNGVAYKIESEELNTLRLKIAQHFWDNLTAQDRQGYRPHITVQNKIKAEVAKELYHTLSEKFVPFTCYGLGLDLWEYLGGPWKHVDYFPLA
ncbi:2'-5' RNA ligase family protein [Pedobacter sp. MC2016-05]|uniref:2'-5' RNA ligase family protein n=1 Tax=Pedobacter sp. MC2016-05 TaxID=2994474 RepID=UPI0022473D08|nr:2'-5' RNA ligase family protein [Pedobacter sp. MC2016-05]MCX2475929.1 2'-5' RNA ligase family protein [Pedobacter sp. MC2016-05]